LFLEQLGERPQTGPDLQYAIRLRQFGRSNDAPQLVGIMQEALPQRLGQPNPSLLQKLPHGRGCHAVLPM
jgi:hypothetical protein